MTFHSAVHRSVVTTNRYRKRFVAAGLLALCCVWMAGCATWQAPTGDVASLRSRALRATHGDIQMRAAVLSSDESRSLFGLDVNGAGVQPVWVEIENPTPQTYWLLRAGTDPDYFSPLEVAWSFHGKLSPQRNAAIDAHLNALAFENPIPPQSTRSGILFTNRHHRTKVLNVDLLGVRHLVPFTLFLPIPDDASDSPVQRVRTQLAAQAGKDFTDPQALRDALEQLPCCADVAGGMRGGDPLNLVMIGGLEDIAAAVVRRGYRRAVFAGDDGQAYAGRPPDFVADKGHERGATSQWLRLWLASFTFRGQPVFLGQVGRPSGGRFADVDRAGTVLHPLVDEARNLLIQDLIYSGGLARLGFVNGVVAGPSGADAHYASDGLRAVLFISTRPLALSDIELLDWVPYLQDRVDAARLQDDAHANP